MNNSKNKIKNLDLVKKRKEWHQIENIIPYISNYLGLDILVFDEKYFYEGPDFLFNNGKISIGIEVTECHPSSILRSEVSAPEMRSKDRRITDRFSTNAYLRSITKQSIVNIILYRGPKYRLKCSDDDVCQEIEEHLKAWYKGIKVSPDKCNFIRKIKVIESRGLIGSNIVQFNNMARRAPVEDVCLLDSLYAKEKKIEKYQENGCDEYWLCIYLPFEENRQSNQIMKDSGISFDKFIAESKFDRICVTSCMPNDIKWLKCNATH